MSSGFLHARNRKPERWGFDSGFVDPKWGWFWNTAVGVWPMWETAGLLFRDLARFGNNGAYTVSGAGGIVPDINGPVASFSSTLFPHVGSEYIDTGVPQLGDVGLFCDSGSPDFTVISRFKNAVDAQGSVVSKAVGDASETTRTFQIAMDGAGGAAPGFWTRGTNHNFEWGIDDGNYHILFMSWDGTTLTATMNNHEQQSAVNVGTAAENTGENVMFGATDGGAGFPLGDASIDFVYILRAAISRGQISQLVEDPYGPIRRADGVAKFVPAASFPFRLAGHGGLVGPGGLVTPGGLA